VKIDEWKVIYCPKNFYDGSTFESATKNPWAVVKDIPEIDVKWIDSRHATELEALTELLRQRLGVKD
jgi:hypothetical protein